MSSARAAAPVYRNILEMIGNTPMLEITRIDTGPCKLFVKMESMNPGNSIKDRIAVTMIEDAEKSGKLKKGGRIVEATAGNTGLALALVAGQKGYRLTVVVPDKMSDEKISHLRAMGAEVVLTRSDVAKGHPEYYQDVAEKIAKDDPDAFYASQFTNEVGADEGESFAGHEKNGFKVWMEPAVCECELEFVLEVRHGTKAANNRYGLICSCEFDEQATKGCDLNLGAPRFVAYTFLKKLNAKGGRKGGIF
jgi:hypothetical protein